MNKNSLINELDCRLDEIDDSYAFKVQDSYHGLVRH